MSHLLLFLYLDHNKCVKLYFILALNVIYKDLKEEMAIKMFCINEKEHVQLKAGTVEY